MKILEMLSVIGDALAPLAHFESVGVCECDVRAEDCRASVELNKISQGIIEVGKVSKILLLPVDCTTDRIGPAATPRQFCNTAVTIWHFHVRSPHRKDTT